MQQPNIVKRFLISLLPSPATMFNLMAGLIPGSIKRKMVMVICFCEIEKMRGVKKPRIGKLNRDLKLIKSESFLHYLKEFSLPLAVEVLPCTDGLCETDLASFCTLMAEGLPPALRYADQASIVTDIATVVAYDVN